MRKPPFDPGKLRLILQVAQSGSLSKVALQERSSQPYISKVIAQVEAECGAPIFRRTGRGMLLTDFGRAVLPRIESWLTAGHLLAEDIHGLSGAAAGHVRLATLPTLSSPWMGRLFQQVRDAFPDIRLSFLEGYAEQIRSWLKNGQADIGVTLRYDGAPREGAHPLVHFDLHLCGAPGDALTRAPTVPFAALDRLPLVVHSQPGLLHDRLQQLCAARALVLDPVVQANSVAIQKDIAASGTAYALLSHTAVATDVQAGRLQASRIVDPPVPQLLDLEFSSTGPVTRPTREVAARLREMVREAAGTGPPEPAPVTRGSPR
jgi:LysR family transcriptional regulator, nitrogen assimilation regulatory protein